MDSNALADLIDLESSLAEAQQLLGKSSQTSLLLDHLELLNQTSVSTNELHISKLKELINQDGAFNLTLSCSTCHQTLFYDDDCAQNAILKEGLQTCCHDTLKQAKEVSELELSYWWFFLNSFSSCIITLPNYTRFMLANRVPASLRSRIWGVASQSCDSTGQVDEYLKTLYESLNTDVSPDISIISKDVNRTFPELSMFCEYDTKIKFERVLNAYSIFDSDMGYCQGLQFIVAPMLFHFKDELNTFNSLVKLFEINKLRTIYDNELSGLNLWFYQFEKILQDDSPELYAHLQKLDIDMNMFLSQWFISFYSITMPFNFMIQMFDIMLLEGVKETLFRVGLTILSQNGKLLESIDDAELIYQHLLSENCWGVFQNNVDEFMQSVLDLDVTRFSQDYLSTLEKKFVATGKKHTSNKSFFTKVLNNFKTTAESVLSSPSSLTNEDKSKSQSTLFSVANSSQLSIEEDFDLVEGLYKLCLDKSIDDPLLNKVRERLYGN